MPSTITDRLYGLTTSIAVKGACRAGTTAAITLHGEQTVDGVALVTGDRCLVKNQADPVYNGIWIVQTGDWTRAADYNGSFDTVTGTIAEVNFGNVNAVTLWRCTSTGVIVIGTDPITWEPLSLSAGANTVLVPMTYVGTPDADGFMGGYVCKDTASFAADLAGGPGYNLGGFIGTRPEAPEMISIQKNGEQMVEVTIGTDGSFTASGDAWTVDEDDAIGFYAEGQLTGADYAMTFAGPIG